MPTSDHYGEVIGSDSQLLEVECHDLYAAPAFGSFVRADCEQSNRRHYAVVTRVTTGPFDGHRVVQAHRIPPEDLVSRKPHLPALLRTTFQAVPIGYGEGGVVVAGISPLPPRLHCWVAPATDAEVRDVTQNYGWLRPLTRSADLPVDELLVAAIRSAASAWGPESSLELVKWGKFLARLLGRDYVTLETVISRLAPLFNPGASLPAATAVRSTSQSGGSARPVSTGWKANGARSAPQPPARTPQPPTPNSQLPSQELPEDVMHPRYEEPLTVYGSTPNGGSSGGNSPSRPSGNTASNDYDPFAEDW